MTCGGCHLPDGARNALVAMVTAVSSLSMVSCLWVLFYMYAYRTCRLQTERITRGVFVANVLFSLAWAFPYHHGITFTSIPQTDGFRCFAAAFYEWSRFLSLCLEVRVLAYSYYCARWQREGISRRYDSGKL